MTVLFRNLRAWGYVFVLILVGGVLGIASYLASQFLPHTRFSYTIYTLVVPSITIPVLIMMLLGSRPWIDALVLLIMSIAWLALAAWTSDINGSADCFSLGSSRTKTKHGTISSRAFCYESKTVEGVSWSIFIILMIFMIFVIVLANKSQILGWPDIWDEDIIDLPWFGERPGYPGEPLYLPNPGQIENQALISEPQTLGNEGVFQQRPGHSIIIWPGVNGGPPRIEQRPGVVTHNTLNNTLSS